MQTMRIFTKTHSLFYLLACDLYNEALYEESILGNIMANFVVPFVERVNSAQLWINHYPLTNLLGFCCIFIQRIGIYQLNSAVQPLNSSCPGLQGIIMIILKCHKVSLTPKYFFAKTNLCTSSKRIAANFSFL